MARRRLAVGQDIVWDMLPNPSTRRSSISQDALEDLNSKGLAPAGSQRRVTLHDLRIDGQRVPAVDAYVSAAVSRLGVDGILGLDFFELFTAIHWYPRTRRVVLINQ